MADRGPQKIGMYERAVRGKGLLIGALVLVALIILAVIFFSGRRAGAATLDAGGGYAVDEPLFREEVEVTRVPIQRVVDAPIPVRKEHGTLIVPVLEEVLVVEKRLILK